MEEENLTNLIERFLAGKANDSEKKQLDDWYLQQSEKEMAWESDREDEEKETEARMFKNIMGRVQQPGGRVVYFNRTFIQRAAAVFVGFALFTGVYFYTSKHQTRKENTLSASVTAPVHFSENKYVTLPDSSVIVLRTGSNIHYAFNGKTRELSLVGEAYFDIKHNAHQPFVIHTGSLTTTVLGTAFNISAYPEKKIIVSVTRGKVSVSDAAHNVLAVLTPNQQASYDEKTKIAGQQEVEALQTIAWIKLDMPSTDMTFKQWADKLSGRYGVKIEFKNKDLENYSISGRFSGTESLQQVLAVLCGTSSSTYKIDGQNVILDSRSY